jgi:hypothetical protein
VITLRCTAKLVRRFALSLNAPDDAVPSNVLGDWYAKPLNVGRDRWVLCLNERSNLPIFVPARNATFPADFPAELRKVLTLLGVPAEIAEPEVQRSSQFRFGKPIDRKIIGSLNDMAFHADFELRRRANPVFASAALSEMPCRLNNVVFPGQAIFALLGIPEMYDRHRNDQLLDLDLGLDDDEDDYGDDPSVLVFPYPSVN